MILVEEVLETEKTWARAHLDKDVEDCARDVTCSHSTKRS
jgi:hypothetical protein